MKQPPIDFLIIGSQKCATTWMYECIVQHPQICLPKHKREHEYIGGDLFKHKGLDWFLSFFQHCNDDKMIGAVSVDYIINNKSPELLYAINPKMKFILSVRNPVERAVSALKWYVRKEEITKDDDRIFENLKKSLQNFDLNNYNPANKFDDVLYRGLYHELIQKYYQYFPANLFLIVKYEDIKHNGKQVLKQIFSFLNVDNSFKPPNVNTQPKKNSNNRILVELERRFPKNKPLSFLINRLHQNIPQKKSFFKHESEMKVLLEDFYKANSKLVSFDK